NFEQEANEANEESQSLFVCGEFDCSPPHHLSAATRAASSLRQPENQAVTEHYVQNGDPRCARRSVVLVRSLPEKTHRCQGATSEHSGKHAGIIASRRRHFYAWEPVGRLDTSMGS